MTLCMAHSPSNLAIACLPGTWASGPRSFSLPALLRLLDLGCQVSPLPLHLTKGRWLMPFLVAKGRKEDQVHPASGA